MESQRNTYIDFLKRALIFLVVFGHFIQYFHGGLQDTFENKIFKAIYLFHMPLFLAISGYFSYFSVKKNTFPKYLKKRNKIFITMIVWSIITYICYLLTKPNVSFNIIDLFRFMIDSYWYIWAIIVYSFIIVIFHKCKLDKPLPLIILCLAVMIIPYRSFLSNMLISMLPFFVTGYLLATIDLKKIISFCTRYWYIFIIASVTCYIIWKPSWFAYLTPSSWEYFDIALIRYFTGVIVSITFMIILHIYVNTSHAFVDKTIVLLGKESLGIYMIQGLFFSFFIDSSYFKLCGEYPSILLILPSLFVTLIFYYFIKITDRNKVIALLLYAK